MKKILKRKIFYFKHGIFVCGINKLHVRNPKQYFTVEKESGVKY